MHGDLVDENLKDEPSLNTLIEADIWTWMSDFVSSPSEFYAERFAPCPYAAGAMKAGTVDVVVHDGEPVQSFIRDRATDVRDIPRLGTRVMVFAPRVQASFGLSDFVERLNADLVPDDVFCNTGVTRTMASRHAGANRRPYFIVVANSLGPVLRGAKALEQQGFYDGWPAEHRAIVVERRARMAERYGRH